MNRCICTAGENSQSGGGVGRQLVAGAAEGAGGGAGAAPQGRRRRPLGQDRRAGAGEDQSASSHVIALTLAL